MTESDVMLHHALTGAARIAGVIGWPVSHSLSPRLHGYWLSAHGIDGAYVPFAVKPDDLVDAVRLLPRLGLRGVNITVPHKEAVMAALDHVDPLARRTGAVNTIIVGDDGTLEGRNTDAYGFMESLREQAPHWRVDAGPAVVLGAGGAARAVIVGLLDAGVGEIRVANRTAARADTLVRDLDDPRLRVVDWAARMDAADNATLLVNTTTLGMGGPGMDGTHGLEMGLEPLDRRAVVADIVYTPLETPLLRAARARGFGVVDGLGMLLHQARPGFAAWFGHDVAVDARLRQFMVAALGGGGS